MCLVHSVESVAKQYISLERYKVLPNMFPMMRKHGYRTC